MFTTTTRVHVHTCRELCRATRTVCHFRKYTYVYFCPREIRQGYSTCTAVVVHVRLAITFVRKYFRTKVPSKVRKQLATVHYSTCTTKTYESTFVRRYFRKYTNFRKCSTCTRTPYYNIMAAIFPEIRKQGEVHVLYCTCTCTCTCTVRVPSKVRKYNFRTFVRKYFRTKISCKNNFNNTVHDYTYVYVYTCTCTVRVLSQNIMGSRSLPCTAVCTRVRKSTFHVLLPS